MVPQRNSNPGRYTLRRQDPPRFVQRGPPPMRNPSEMFFGRPPEKKPSEGKFIGGKNFYVLIVGLVIIIALLIILFSVKNENQNNNNANFSGNNPTNSSYQFINNIGNNANDNIPTDDGSDNGNLNGNDDDDSVSQDNSAGVDLHDLSIDDILNSLNQQANQGGESTQNCTTEWVCLRDAAQEYKVYQSSSCTYSNQTVCVNGCYDGGCLGNDSVSYSYNGSTDVKEYPFNFISPYRFIIYRTGETLTVRFKPERWLSDPDIGSNIDYNAVYDYYTIYLEGVGEIGSTTNKGVYTWVIPQSLSGKTLGGYNYRILVYAESTDILHARSQPFDIIPAGDTLPQSTRFKIGDRIKNWQSLGQDPKYALFGPGTIVGGPKLNDAQNSWMWNVSFDNSIDQSKNGWINEGALDSLYLEGFPTEPLTAENWHYYDFVVLDKDVQLNNTCTASWYCRDFTSKVITGKAGDLAKILSPPENRDGRLWWYIYYNNFNTGEGWVEGSNLRRIIGDSSKILLEVQEYSRTKQKGTSASILFKGGINSGNSPASFARVNWGDGTAWESYTCSNYLKTGRNCLVNHVYSVIGNYNILLSVDDGLTNARAEKLLPVSIVDGSTKFVIGDNIKTSSYLYVRKEPSDTSTFNGRYDLGATGTITKAAVQSGIVFDSSGNAVLGRGYNWYWYVDFDNADLDGNNFDGWVDEKMLVKVTEIVSLKFVVGQKVKTTSAVSVLGLPMEPWFSQSNNLVDTKSSGVQGTVKSYYNGTEGTYWKVDFSGFNDIYHKDGWVAESKLGGV